MHRKTGIGFSALVLFIVVPPSLATEKLCCVCSGPMMSFPVRTSPDGLSCRNACQANEKPVDDVGFNIDASASCATAPLPPSLTQQNLDVEVKYMIAHQGVSPWKDGQTDEMIPPNIFRASLANTAGDKRLIKLASDSMLANAMKAAATQCVAEGPDLSPHFAYVCKVMSQHDQMVSTLSNGSYNLARDLFSKQQNDPKIKNRLRCYSNTQIARMINASLPRSGPCASKYRRR